MEVAAVFRPHQKFIIVRINILFFHVKVVVLTEKKTYHIDDEDVPVEATESRLKNHATKSMEKVSNYIREENLKDRRTWSWQ